MLFLGRKAFPEKYGKGVGVNKYEHTKGTIPVSLVGLPDGVYTVRVLAGKENHTALITLQRG